MAVTKEIFIKLDIKTVAAFESAMAVRAKVWAEAARAVSAVANEVFLKANDVYLKAVDEADAIYYKTVEMPDFDDVAANEDCLQARAEARAVRDNACPGDPRVVFEKARDAAWHIRMEASMDELWAEKDKGK